MTFTFETFKKIFPRSARRLKRYFRTPKLKRIMRKRRKGY